MQVALTEWVQQEIKAEDTEEDMQLKCLEEYGIKHLDPKIAFELLAKDLGLTGEQLKEMLRKIRHKKVLELIRREKVAARRRKKKIAKMSKRRNRRVN